MLSAPILLPASILAFVTTLHASLVVLRQHRSAAGRFTPTILPSLALSVSPWVFPTTIGVVAGFGAHIAWFTACEWLFPTTARLAASASPGTRRTTVEGRGSSPRSGAGPASSPQPARDTFVAVPVLAIIDETPTIRTFRLRRPEGFGFAAGQFLTIRVLVDGRPYVRCYSISSAPEASGCLEISVKRQGLVSGMLHSTVRAGSTLMVRPPAGKFVYPAHDDRPVVLVGGGVGITPLMSILRHAVLAEPGRPVTLLYSARGESELAFWDELRWIVRRHPHVRIGVTLTGPCDGWAGRQGRMSASFVQDFVGEAAHSVFLVCGPHDMIEATRRMLSALGVPAGQVRSEVFQAAAAIGATAPLEGEGRDAPVVSGAETPTLQLHLARRNQRVTVSGHQTLLDAAEAAGVPMESLCRSGVCGTCRARLVDGDVRCTSDALGEREREDGWILPCVSWARSDVTLDV
ncbi:MAG: iron-sulfur cluster-binding domain-containing protein [Acidobacteriota bacterium]